MVAAAQINGYHLSYASAELRADANIMLAAVVHDGYALQHASIELRANTNVVLAAVNQNGCSLKYASLKLRGSRDIAFAAVTQNGCALQFVLPELRASVEVVLAAVHQNGSALKYTSIAACDTSEVVQTAVASCGRALQYASQRLRDDKHLSIAAITQDCTSIRCIKRKHVDINVARAAVTANPLAVTVIPSHLFTLASCCRAVVDFDACVSRFAKRETIRPFMRAIVAIFHDHLGMSINEWLAIATVNCTSITTFMLVSCRLSIGQSGCGSSAFNQAVVEYVGMSTDAVPHALIMETNRMVVKNRHIINFPKYDRIKHLIDIRNLSLKKYDEGVMGTMYYMRRQNIL